jgi:hypothetical protein
MSSTRTVNRAARVDRPKANPLGNRAYEKSVFPGILKFIRLHSHPGGSRFATYGRSAAQINSQIPLGNDLNHDQPKQADNHPQK